MFADSRVDTGNTGGPVTLEVDNISHWISVDPPIVGLPIKKVVIFIENGQLK